MEIRELYSILPLKAELAHERRRKIDLIQQSASICSTLTGMPRSGTVSSKVETFAIRIHDTDKRIQYLEERIDQLESYIDDVDDDIVRAVMKLKFVDGYTYAMIALQIGGRNSKDSIKKMLYRYIQKERLKSV